MELVYLWVKNYKNIHDQGFNFSSRFNCDYNKKTNEFTIKENDDYISDFFGKNINVTAIVGKNGSGKSSLLETIYSEIASEYEDTMMAVYFNGKHLKYNFRKLNVKIVNKSTVKIYKHKVKTSLDYISLSPFINELFYNEVLDELTYEYYVKKNENVTFYTIENHCSDSTNDNMFRGYKCFKSLMFFEQLKFLSDKENIEFLEKTFNIREPFYLNVDFKDYKGLDYNLSNVIMNNLDILLSIIVHANGVDLYEGTSTIFSDNYEDIKKELREEYAGYTTQDLIDKENIIDVFLKKSNNMNAIPLDEKKTIQDFFNIYDVSQIESYFQLSFLDSNGNEIHLSSGEQTILFYLTKIQQSSSDILIIDEVDLFLHPKWQKEILTIFLNYINLKSNKQKHLILSSHSPFILSDIPKQNIIFLDKDESGKCQVLKHNEVLEKKQTFGQNIHTLLSDGFFMEDGLIGEFAKSKINEIKKLYQLIQNKNIQKRLENKKTKELAQKAFNRRKKRLWQIEKIIGEAFLQRVIKNYLDELELLFSDDKTLIAKELAEIEERKKHLEALQKRKG